MSDIPQPKSGHQEPRLPQQVDESQVVNPINIARARHASAHANSVAEEAAKAKATATKTPVAKSAKVVVAAPASNNLYAALFGNSNGCMILALFGLTFFFGSIVGGLVGGGLFWTVVRRDRIALADQATLTLTPPPSPTPMPVATATPTPPPPPSPTPAMEDIIAEIIPSVVTIINQQDQNLGFNPEEGRVVGSGIIVDERGYIATNNHVVERPGQLRVVLSDGRSVDAILVIGDPAEDLALLKVQAENLLPIKWGDSTLVRPGQAVYAIGSPLGDFPNSVSFGIVSGLNRALEMDEYVIDGLIQTDAAINRGSSGGPLIAVSGEVIGINTFIIRESEDRGVAEGIAFALPTQAAKTLLLPWIAAHGGETVPIPAAEEPGGN